MPKAYFLRTNSGVLSMPVTPHFSVASVWKSTSTSSNSGPSSSSP